LLKNLVLFGPRGPGKNLPENPIFPYYITREKFCQEKNFFFFIFFLDYTLLYIKIFVCQEKKFFSEIFLSITTPIVYEKFPQKSRKK